MFRGQVCYAESPNLFFVHVSVNDSWPYRTLRKSLALFDSPVLRDPHEGNACVVKHLGANVRGKIVEWVCPGRFKVELVDFGLIETFADNDIKITDNEFLKQPPFAIECCLKDFESDTPLIGVCAENVIKKFESTCREIPEFDIQVIKRTGNRYIVEVPDWKKGPRGLAQSVELDRSDWSEANTTIETHFAKNRNAKRKFADESDDEEMLWQDCPLDGDPAESSDSKRSSLSCNISLFG